VEDLQSNRTSCPNYVSVGQEDIVVLWDCKNENCLQLVKLVTRQLTLGEPEALHEIVVVLRPLELKPGCSMMATTGLVRRGDWSY